jgi:hypothetical protein
MAFGSVANAAPSLVMPDDLASSFSVASEFLSDINVYRGGERQVELKASTSRKAWTITKALTIDEIYALRNFFQTVGADPFYFYDTVSDLTVVYDATGTLTDGRYTVRFDGPWQQTSPLGYSTADIRLIEVA